MIKKAFNYLIPIYVLWLVIHVISFINIGLGAAFSGREPAPTMFIPLMISHFLVIFVGIGFWIWMLVDAALRKFDNDSERVVWILVVILAQGVGAIIYFYMHGNKPLKK